MKVKIRQADTRDQDIFIDFSVKLSQFNRSNHNDENKMDNYDAVVEAIRKKAKATCSNVNEDTLILIAESDGIPVGYALARIFEEDATADNGTGRVGLIDEIFVEDSARGLGLGRRLLEETIIWLKDRKINRIKLHAYSWNAGARKLYERYGFREYAVAYELFV